MGTTLRYANGFKSDTSKYVIRKSVKIHLYKENGVPKVRITKSLYVGKKEKQFNYSKTATLDCDSNAGGVKRYVAIS